VQLLKDDGELSANVYSASQKFVSAFDSVLPKGPSLRPEEALHFRECVAGVINAVDEWRVGDKPRFIRELRLKLFTCVLIRKRFPMLINSSVKVDFACLLCYPFKLTCVVAGEGRLCFEGDTVSAVIPSV